VITFLSGETFLEVLRHHRVEYGGMRTVVEEWVSVEYVDQMMEWSVMEVVVKMLINLHGGER
jgi:hypothetical protein